MKSMRPVIPVSVPESAAGGQTGISDVTASVGTDPTALDKGVDARMSAQKPAAPTNGTGEDKASVGSNGEPPAQKGTQQAAATPQNQPLPTNHPLTKQQIKMMKKAQEKAAKKQKKNRQKPAEPASTAQPAATASAAPAAQPAGQSQ
jgi:hypothetical protein